MNKIRKQVEEAQSLIKVLIANEECLYSRLGMTESSIDKISSSYGIFKSSAEDNLKYLLRDLNEIYSIQMKMLSDNGIER